MSTTEVAVYDVSRLPAERGHDSLVRPAADTHAIMQSFVAYGELCDQLLTKDDYQTIGKKDFRKKSGWRKLAVAFGVSIEMQSETEARTDDGRIIRAKVVVRAIAPNGRFTDGLGVAEIHEKCCIKEYCNNKSHTHCRPGCPGTIHFSGVEHDIPATAYTRAANRACSDLFGMGEVSAEEITNGGEPGGGQPQSFGANQDAGPDPDGWARENGWAEGSASIVTAKKAVRAALAQRVEAGVIESSKATELWHDYLRPEGPQGAIGDRTLPEHEGWLTANMPEMPYTPEGQETPPAAPAPAASPEPGPAQPEAATTAQETAPAAGAIPDEPSANDYEDNTHRSDLDKHLAKYGHEGMLGRIGQTPDEVIVKQLQSRGVDKVSTAWGPQTTRSLLAAIVMRNAVNDARAAAKPTDGDPF